jgi:hypothetical protein
MQCITLIYIDINMIFQFTSLFIKYTFVNYTNESTLFFILQLFFIIKFDYFLIYKINYTNKIISTYNNYFRVMYDKNCTVYII